MSEPQGADEGDGDDAANSERETAASAKPKPENPIAKQVTAQLDALNDKASALLPGLAKRFKLLSQIAQISLAALGIIVGLALIFGLMTLVAENGRRGDLRGMTTLSLIGGTVAGFLVGFCLWLITRLFTKYARLTAIAAVLFLILIGDVLAENAGITMMTSSLGGGVGFFAALGFVLSMLFTVQIEPATKLPNVFGSSRWATRDDLVEWGLLGAPGAEKADAAPGLPGLFLGIEPQTGEPIVYDGDMHALTVAPTRTGKGATAIIPNLLRSNSSILVIDPKGENARRTAEKRIALGQKVFIVDPWAVSCDADRYGPGVDAKLLARFNPLDALDPDDPDFVTDAMLLADALVVDDGSRKDPFWADEARAMIHGFILYVMTEEKEAENRTLARVRDILSLPPALPEQEDLDGTINEVIEDMRVSDHASVQAAGARFLQKAPKERASVISTAQSNTHFLDSPKIRESLAHSDFRFRDLKTGDSGITVYLTLPLDRLQTFSPWLRLLVSSALIDLTRAPLDPEKPPVRIILDEFAALKRLELIETAYGTMAGLGVQLWALTQDLGQLMRLYGDKSWQTFISNAGVLQYFGSRDYETAKYAEHLCGMTTMKKRAISFGTNWGSSSTSGSGPGGGSYSSTSSRGGSETISYDDVSRPLAYADEMMTLHRALQVLFVENRYPIVARKWWWFAKH